MLSYSHIKVFKKYNIHCYPVKLQVNLMVKSFLIESYRIKIWTSQF